MNIPELAGGVENEAIARQLNGWLRSTASRSKNEEEEDKDRNRESKAPHTHADPPTANRLRRAGHLSRPGAGHSGDEGRRPIATDANVPLQYTYKCERSELLSTPGVRTHSLPIV